MDVLAIGYRGGGTRAEQMRQHHAVAVEGGQMQRRHAVLVLDVDVGALLGQQLHGLPEAAQRGGVQWRAAARVQLVDKVVNIAAVLLVGALALGQRGIDQQRGAAHVAIVARVGQRRALCLVDQRGVGVVLEQDAHRRAVALEGSLWRVGVCQTKYIRE